MEWNVGFWGGKGLFECIILIYLEFGVFFELPRIIPNCWILLINGKYY